MVANIQYSLLVALRQKELHRFIQYFSDEDTYIRRAAYISIGRIYIGEYSLRNTIKRSLFELKEHQNELVRQTVVNAAGEIGVFRFEEVSTIFDEALFDEHHKVRNAVIGSLKKMNQKNPWPKVISALNTWENKELISDAIDEIIDIHSEKRYAKFTALTQDEVVSYIPEKLKH